MDDLSFKIGFLRLPSELILLVGSSLEYHSEINPLPRVSRRFHNLLNPVLYQRIDSSGDRYALTWAVCHGVEAAARKTILAGVTPTLDDVKIAIRKDNEPMVELSISEIAASRGNISTIRLLIIYGANPPTANQPNSNLFKAARCGDIQVAEMLVEAGANMDTPPDGRDTPLKRAAENGHLQMAKWLLDHGADPNSYCDESFFHNNSLDSALLGGHLDVAQMYSIMVLKSGRACYLVPFVTSIPGEQDKLGCVAASFGFIDVLTNLVMQGWWVESDQLIDFPGYQVTPLTFAARNGQVRAVHFLMSHGAKGLVRGFYGPSLLNALAEGHEEIVRILLENLKDELPAYCDCPKEVLNALVQHGFDPHPENDHEKQALLQAIKRQNSDLLHLLISRGFNVRRPEWQASFLECAASAGGSAAETVDLVLAEGLDTEALDENHATPLLRLVSKAMPNRFLNGVRILLKRGANPCYESPSGECPLTVASGHQEDSSVAEALLECIDKRDDIPISVV
ncbi:ankyrin repeat-containing domain protein [Aspergillus filifer]